jgi:DnaJ family protein C protein 7
VRQYEKAVNMGENSAQEKLRHAQKQQKMASRKDYYKILELTKGASPADIKKAYRKLAMLYHPGNYSVLLLNFLVISVACATCSDSVDRLKAASAEEKAFANAKMKDVGEAYAILSDAEKKATYDRGDEFDQQHANPFYGFQGFQGFNFKFN